MKQTIEAKFKIGDVVTLNNNDKNPMTVKTLKMELNRKTVEYDLFYGIVKCSWFENDTFKESEFHQDMLQLVIKN